MNLFIIEVNNARNLKELELWAAWTACKSMHITFNSKQTKPKWKFKYANIYYFLLRQEGRVWLAKSADSY